MQDVRAKLRDPAGESPRPENVELGPHASREHRDARGLEIPGDRAVVIISTRERTDPHVEPIAVEPRRQVVHHALRASRAEFRDQQCNTRAFIHGTSVGSPD